MATTIFNNLVIKVARRLQETKADDAGYLAGTTSRYSAVLVAGYVNNAVRDTVKLQLQMHGDRLPEVMPEMVRTIGPVALVAGLLSRPVDCLYTLGMHSGSTLFRPIRGRDVSAALSGLDPSLKGTTAEPTFYEETSTIKALGVLAADSLYVRYVVLHQDITISTVAAGNGKWLTGANGAYTLATKRLVGTFNSALVAGDATKEVLFRTATKVYSGRITSVVNGTTATLDGTDLPAADIAAGSVLQILISDLSPQTTDLQLQSHWHGDVEELAVQKGILDAKRGLLQNG